MEIYLLRHGSAARAAAGEADSERPLTEDGENEVRRVVAAAKLAQASPSLILSSPYKRARQTANIAADVLDYKGPLLASETLTPEADPHAVWEEIRAHRSEAGILLAGHEPLFSATTAYLLGCQELHVHFAKAGLARIDMEQFGAAPHGVLQWMVTPSLTV